MKKFLAIYTGTPGALGKWKAMNEAQRMQQEKAGMRAWETWASAHAKSILDPGTPIGKTKRISAQGISATTNEICAYTIIQADSHEDAANLFVNHPYFMIFPGDSVDVMECLPMPEM